MLPFCFDRQGFAVALHLRSPHTSIHEKTKKVLPRFTSYKALLGFGYAKTCKARKNGRTFIIF